MTRLEFFIISSIAFFTISSTVLLGKDDSSQFVQTEIMSFIDSCSILEIDTNSSEYILQIIDTLSTEGINSEKDTSSNMNSIEELVEFLKATWGTLNFWIILLLLLVNIIIGVLQLVLPLGYTKRESALHEYKFKINKKHECIENIYIQMCNIFNSLLFDDRQALIDKLTLFKNYSGLYIDDKTKQIIADFIEAAEVQNESQCINQINKFISKYNSK